jgi:hypothetical protein
VVNTENGNVTKLTNCSKYFVNFNVSQLNMFIDSLHGSWTLYDVHQDFVLASVSAPNRPPLLLIGRIPSIDNETKVCYGSSSYSKY